MKEKPFEITTGGDSVAWCSYCNRKGLRMVLHLADGEFEPYNICLLCLGRAAATLSSATSKSASKDLP